MVGPPSVKLQACKRREHKKLKNRKTNEVMEDGKQRKLNTLDILIPTLFNYTHTNYFYLQILIDSTS